MDLAAAAGARYLVSRDKDLLSLMQDEAFRQQFPDLTIVDPVAFLREIRRLPTKGPEETGERGQQSE